MVEKAHHILILSSWYPTKEALFIGNFVQRQAELLSSEYQVTVLHTKSELTLNEIEISDIKKGSLR